MRKVTLNQWWHFVIREYDRNNLDAKLDKFLEGIRNKWYRVQAWFVGAARIRNWRNYTTTGWPKHTYIKYLGGNWYARRQKKKEIASIGKLRVKIQW